MNNTTLQKSQESNFLKQFEHSNFSRFIKRKSFSGKQQYLFDYSLIKNDSLRNTVMEVHMNVFGRL